MDPKSISAFPVPGWKNDADFNGMTLRDYFAAKAMAVVWADIPNDVDRDLALSRLGDYAYEMAEAMLAAR